MRTFVALKFPEQVLEKVRVVQEELRKKNLFAGKFVKKENLHLTLKFLGEIDEEKIEKVKKKLKEVEQEWEGFFGEEKAGGLGGLGVFSEKFVRIIWLRIFGVDKLQKVIDEKLSEVGFEKERRFMSHLTIARVKKVEDRKKLLKELEKINIGKLEFDVKGFLLMKSELEPEGARYEILRSYGFVE